MHLIAIEEHFREYYPRMIKKMTFRAGTHWAAEDVVMEAYARAIRYSRSFDGSNLDRWFSTILNNSLREYKNLEKGYTPLEESDEEMVECPAYSKHVMRDVYKLIQEKSPAQQEVLTLYFKQEYNAKDISRITQYSYANTHQIIQRFRNELKEMYRE